MTPPRDRSDPAVDDPRGHDRLERVEERLAPEVRTVESGRVRVDRRVVEEPEEVEVSLRHDEIDLDRRPADRPLAPEEEPVAVRGDETVILVVEERLEVRKVPWVVEEIRLRRRVETESRQVAETVRRERYDIHTEGDVDLDQP